MNSIPSYMTERHRHCDEAFIGAEAAAAKNDWSTAKQQWDIFATDLEHHLQQEETLLFPAFEEATGMTCGPTQVMRGEHVQMRQLVKEMTQALGDEDKAQYLGLSETLMILMQQHNMKEEQVLYPMSQQAVTDADSLLKAMQSHQ